jgi:hypothetical protein
MSKVPHTQLDPFFTGFPVVIKCTPTFEAGAEISDLTSAVLTAQIQNMTAKQRAIMTIIDGTVTKDGGDVKMVFAPTSLTAGSWHGYLACQSDLLATFTFTVEAPL